MSLHSGAIDQETDPSAPVRPAKKSRSKSTLSAKEQAQLRIKEAAVDELVRNANYNTITPKKRVCQPILAYSSTY